MNSNKLKFIKFRNYLKATEAKLEEKLNKQNKILIFLLKYGAGHIYDYDYMQNRQAQIYKIRGTCPKNR